MGRTLAEAALRLKPRGGLPRLVILTDRHVRRDWEEIVRRMPKGSALILRDYDFAGRVELGRILRALTRARRIRLIVAGDVKLARELKADGIHLPEFRLGRRYNFPKDWLVTAAVHGRSALTLAHRSGATLALLSPVFRTHSHPEVRPLGVIGFRRLSASSAIPVAALGGVTGVNARALREAAALAAIRGI